MKEKITLNFRFPTDHPNFNELADHISKAMNLLPDKVKEFIILDNKVIFSAEYKNFRANALAISKKDFLDSNYLIHFNYHIWDFDEKEITRIIQHEMAHAYLQHDSAGISQEENDKQEKEAHELVKEWEKQRS